MNTKSVLVSGLFYCRIDFDDALRELSELVREKQLNLSVILQTEMAPRDFYNILQKNLGVNYVDSPVGGNLGLLSEMTYCKIDHTGCILSGFIEDLMENENNIELEEVENALGSAGLARKLASTYSKSLLEGGIIVLAQCENSVSYLVRDILKYKCAYNIFMGNCDERRLIFEYSADQAEFILEEQNAAA